MNTLSEYQLWYGVDRPPSETRELRAGPLVALLDGIDLRYIRLGSLETVRRIYVAVRDQNWNTIPGVYSIKRIDQQQDSFEVDFDVEHLSRDIHFVWHGRIMGTPDGQIRYQMDGTAKNEFRYNRIGLCILHPFKEYAGQTFTAITPQGAVSGQLPEYIGPQGFEDGFYVPLFPAFDSLTVNLAQGIQARLSFEGDLFEMEDQRNWTDASFKTYCTPLSLGYPHQAHVDTHLAQRFTVSIEGAPVVQQQETPSLRLSIGQPTTRHFPAIGFSMNSDETSLTTHELELLRVLHPEHIRVDIHLISEYAAALEQAIETCQALNCALEIALFFTQEMSNELHRLAKLLHNRIQIARFLLFQEGAQTAHISETTAPELVALARQHLSLVVPHAVFVGGTDMYFCELNRTRPNVEVMDGVGYTIIPQAHAFDERSLTETLEAQAETVKSAQSFSAGRPIVISPVTFKRRYNPHATVAEAERAFGELPDAVDPRQMSLYGTAWTVGSLKYLAESGASSVTYYELTGWLGVMERDKGSPLPEHFPSKARTVFPLYHIFADVAEWKNCFIVECHSNSPLTVAALAVQSEGRLRLLVVNFTSLPQKVVLGTLATSQVSLRSLDAQTVQEAMLQPERFRQQWKQTEVRDKELILDLAPFATVRIDVEV